MVKHPIVVLTERAYAALWNAVVKTGDEDSKRYFKEAMHQQKLSDGNYYYTTEKGNLWGFLDEIQEKKVPCDINLILHNTYNKRDFIRKYPNV